MNKIRPEKPLTQPVRDGARLVNLELLTPWDSLSHQANCRAGALWKACILGALSRC